MDYVLIICMKKYEIAYHNYAEAKRAHQVQNIIYSNPAINILRSVKTTAHDQSNNIQWYNDISFNVLCTELTIELPENCICLNQSEFFMYIINSLTVGF